MLPMKALHGACNGQEKQYVDDVFSTYLYTGNGSTQTITNGIDLAGKGGLVWIKGRNYSGDQHILVDSVRGSTQTLASNLTNAQLLYANAVSSFSLSGFDLDSNDFVNRVNINFASWTFRKAPKFFDIVTYTGNGVAGKKVAHNLGVAPGMIIIKSTTNALNWAVYHKDVGNGALYLNTTSASFAPDVIYWNNTSPTSSEFTLGSWTAVNTNGASYVAYLFAHDDSAEGLIQCGSFNLSTSTAEINLGWEPQYILMKESATSGDWLIHDNMRGISDTTYTPLRANLSSAESNGSGNAISLTPTGFVAKDLLTGAATTCIYLAIRRPNKPPKTGAEVYNAIAYTSDGVAAKNFPMGSQVDLLLHRPRVASDVGFCAISRLTGTPYLHTSATSTEAAQTAIALDVADGFKSLATYSGLVTPNYPPSPYNTPVALGFKRAPGFFDVVAYTGNGVLGATQSHSLGVNPELIIIKSRSVGGAQYPWLVNVPGVGVGFLNTTDTISGPTLQTSTTTFTLGNANNNNGSGTAYVAYLFATKAGISKVGSYTGNGSSQTIPCGFTTGARFILIKRTDSTGDWYVWDSVRGIVAANDPHLSLNTTAAEVTTDDSVDPASSGFIVNQVAATNINVNGASYIYLAIA